MISKSVKVSISFAKKGDDDLQIRKDCSGLVSDGTPLLAAVKFFLQDERLFQLFASISFPTWEMMQTVMIGFFGNTANDNQSTNALKVASFLSKWVEENQKRHRAGWNVTDNGQAYRSSPYCSFSEIPVDAMTLRFSKFVGSDNNGIFHRLSEWGILCLLRTKNEHIQESLVLNDLFRDFGELPRTVHELLCKRSAAKGKEKTAFLHEVRGLLPQVKTVMETLEENLKKVFVCESEGFMEERRVSVFSADMLDYGNSRYSENARSFFKFQHLKDFGFFEQREKNDDRFQEIRKAIFDASKYVPEYGDNLHFLCKLSLNKLLAICVFVEYSHRFFRLFHQKNATGKCDEKIDDAQFLERWSRFAFGSLDSKFLKNYKNTVPYSSAPKLSSLLSSYRSLDFKFEHIMKLKCPESLFRRMDYCVCLSKSLRPLISLHTGKVKDETRIDIEMAHLSCPTDLKNAQNDLRFRSHHLNARLNLYHNRRDLDDLKKFWDVAVECNIFRSKTIAGSKIYMKNILTMMKNAKSVKDMALEEKEKIAALSNEELKKRTNQVTITARPKAQLVDGKLEPVMITLDIDGVETEIPMAGFTMVFVSTPLRDKRTNEVIDPSFGHVVIYRKFETKQKEEHTVLFGVINNDGKFLHTKAINKYLDVPKGEMWINGYGDLLTLLRVLDAMPSKCSNILAKMTGSCLYCCKPMTTDESMESGFGPICMEKLGLTKEGLKSLVPQGVYQLNKDNKVVSNAPSFKARTEEMESPSKKLKTN